MVQHWYNNSEQCLTIANKVKQNILEKQLIATC